MPVTANKLEEIVINVVRKSNTPLSSDELFQKVLKKERAKHSPEAIRACILEALQNKSLRFTQNHQITLGE